MITLTEDLKLSEHIRRRAALMWAVKLRGNDPSIVRYRVKPFGNEFGHHNKAKRIVEFNLENQTAECVNRFTGEVCEANSDFVPGRPDVPKTPRLCSHVWAAWSTYNIKRQGRKAA